MHKSGQADGSERCRDPIIGHQEVFKLSTLSMEAILSPFPLLNQLWCDIFRSDVFMDTSDTSDHG